MPKRVAVVSGGPTWRRGISAILSDAGYATVELDSLAAWRPGRGGAAIALRLTGDDALAAIESFVGDHPHIPIVAVMPTVGVGEYAAALRRGATGAIAEDEPAAAFALAFDAAFLSTSAAPTRLIRAMAARMRPTPADKWLSDADISRLKMLARAATVADVAEQSGYSEREMFRILNALYRTLGVESRTQAVIWAAHHGLLDEGDAIAD